MSKFTADIVLDIPVTDEILVFAGGIAINALGLVRGLDIVRLILSHPILYDLRRPVDKAYEPISIAKARVKYPFLFFGGEGTNPLLYREF